VSEFREQFERPGEVAASADSATADPIEGRSWDESTASPISAAMRELDTIGDRDLAEHPDVYQRIHTELQAALTTIDDA
jgi:hypothetical protein